MKHSWIFLILICCILISYLYFAFLRNSYDVLGFNYKVGQIADRDVIAPFTFSVYKSPETIEKEQERLDGMIEPIYRISDEVNYRIFQQINLFMGVLSGIEQSNFAQINTNLSRQLGFTLTEEMLTLLLDQNKRIQLIDHLTRSFNSILTIGIYGSDIEQTTIQIVNNGELRRSNLESLYSIDKTYTTVISEITDPRMKAILQRILSHFIENNIVLDTERMNRLRQEAYQTIDPILTEVLENEEIIRKNRRISETDMRKLDALSTAYRDYVTESELPELLLSTIAYFLLSVLLLFSGYLIFRTYIKEHYQDTRHTVIYTLLILLTTILAFFVAIFPALHTMILPFSMAVLIFALIFTPLGGILFSMISYILILPFFNWNVIDTSIIFLTTILIMVIMTRMKDNHDFIPLSIYILFSFMITASVIALLIPIPRDDYLLYVLYGIISCAISIAGMVLLSPIIEKRLNLATKMILLELLDTNNPILKRMAMEAPGTFHHSITVGVLAESAAEAIGANPLLARVGSYYHDIGKLENPDIFIENNSEATALHDKMEIYESVANIKNHVLEGLSLAKKYKLPQQVIDIIKQHHGDNKVGYFYNKAKESNKPIEDESVYHYYGPRPQTKEAALVMIADIVESTAKAQMHQHTEESLKKIVNDTIQRLIIEGQLSETPITLRELETTKSYMLPIIIGIYRKRIEYPAYQPDQ